MIEFLYNIIIFPLVLIIEIAFTIFYRISRDKVIAIIGVSVAVSGLTMPLYFIAEKWQKIERETVKLMSPMVKNIKSVFKGDERFMILEEFYRQNHYHPVYALRNSFGILIQVPFFLAAYTYLSNLDFIKDTSFLFIRNLGAPDNFLVVGNFHLNILPVLMTIINIISASIYTRDLFLREKVQSYAMPLIFLVILYNSPSGLVLYWTMNNVFSLLKNLLAKSRHVKKIIFLFLCFCVILIYIRFVPLGFSPKRLFVLFFSSLIFFIPFFIYVFKLIKIKYFSNLNIHNTSLSSNCTYIISAIILLILCGFLIPGSLISSSVQEFSFLENYTTPLPFLFTVFTQALGLFIFWPLIIYFLFSKKAKYFICFLISMFSVFALINVFIFPGDYGYLSTSFIFSNPDTFESKYTIIIISSIITIAILGVTAFLLFYKRKLYFKSIQLILLITLTLTGFMNLYKIVSGFHDYTDRRSKENTVFSTINKIQPVYKLSSTGKNVIVIMVDSAISGYIPQIFNEKPELLSSYSGFIYYPNCVSFGAHTRIGAPVVFGGYEYQPKNIQKNRSFALEKHNEALLMMPRIFLNEGFDVTVTDPSFANYSWKPDLSIFKPFSGINARNIVGSHTDIWMRAHPDLKLVSIPDLLNNLLIRFSLFKIAPPSIRVFIYDLGNWLKAGELIDNQLTLDTLDNYSTLDYFIELTEITGTKINTFSAITNDLPHYYAFFQFPDYVPSINVTNYGEGPYSQYKRYHAAISTIMLLGKWLTYLQENNVYNNTRFVFTADHGGKVDSKYPGNIILPDGFRLSSFHPILLYKDFNSNGELIVNNEFMTNADVPFLAMNELIDNPVNPFSGMPVKTDKGNGITITTSNQLQFIIKENQWLHVKDNIFDVNNWEKVN